MLLGLVPKVCVKGGKGPNQTNKHTLKQTEPFLEHGVSWAKEQNTFLEHLGSRWPIFQNVFWGKTMFGEHGSMRPHVPEPAELMILTGIMFVFGVFSSFV